MSMERLKFMGRRQEKIMQAESLRLRIAGTLSALREEADPTVIEENLDGKKIAQLALELADKVTSLKSLLSEIAKIDEILGK